MRLIVIAIVVFLIVVLVAYRWFTSRFDRYARELMDQVRGEWTVPARGAVDNERLPAVVRRYLASALVATSPARPRCAHLVQSAELRMGPNKPWKALRCEQVIATGHPGFVWYAEQPFGPISIVRVIDAYVSGHGYLQARLFGSLPVANASGPELDRGELMRYLAELAWAPDAIVFNHALRWRAIEDNAVVVEADSDGGVAQVRLYFDRQGNIVEMQADERNAMENGKLVPRPWRGLFSDHHVIGGRRIPTRAEVGYVYDSGYAAYWRGQITEYRVEYDRDVVSPGENLS